MTSGSGDTGNKCNEGTKIAAYTLVGFCLLLTLRVGLNGALFCIRRFKIPDHLFSLYVSRVHNCMELSAFAGITIGTIYNFKYSDTTCGPKKEYVSIAINWFSFLINLVLLIVFVTGGENGSVTLFYWTLALSAAIYGMNHTFILGMARGCIVWYLSTFRSSAIFTSILHFIMLKIVGNRRRYDTDFIVVATQISISVIFIFASAAVWTKAYWDGGNTGSGESAQKSDGKCNGADKKDSAADSDNGGFQWRVLSPMAMCTIGQGIVYAVYPGIAPGMLIDFKYVNIVDQVLLVIAPIPAIIVAIISKSEGTKGSGPGSKWDGSLAWWHATHIFSITEVVCAYLFIYSLHFPNSRIGTSLVNKPGMTGFLTVLFFTCYMTLMAVGYTGVDGNCGKQYENSIPIINNFIGCFILLAFVFLGEGYITEFQNYERINWPTIGMSNRKAFGYWVYKSYKNAAVSIRHLFTLNLRKDLLFAFQTIDLS